MAVLFAYAVCFSQLQVSPAQGGAYVTSNDPFEVSFMLNFMKLGLLAFIALHARELVGQWRRAWYVFAIPLICAGSLFWGPVGLAGWLSVVSLLCS